MGQSKIIQRMSHFDERARLEQLRPPQIVQETKAVRHPTDMRVAFCKNDASTGETIDCYLDTDGTGTVIEVNFPIAQNGSDMNACMPFLLNGDRIFVTKIGSEWWCVHVFNESIVCDCYEEPPP